jgi:hypothetical protein
MVAGDNADVQVRGRGLGLAQEAVELLLRRCRWIGIVVDVAGDQQRVYLFGDDGCQQPVQKALVLVGALETVQGLAQMPVRSVQKTHCGKS